jgi:hypothetical protein
LTVFLQTYVNDILKARILPFNAIRDYVATYQNTKNTYKSAKQTADNQYISTVTVGWNTYNNKVDNLDALFESALAQAGDSNFAPATFFNNGTSGNQGNMVLVGNKKDDSISDKHWSDSINMSKNGVNAWIAAPFKWIGNKISPLLPNFRETDPQEGAERRQELSQRRVTVDKLNNIKSSALNDMNRAVFTEDTIQSDILHTQNIIDGIHNTEYAAKNAIIVGSFLLPGPDDAVMAMILSKNGLTIIKGEMGYIIKKGTQVLTGHQEQKAILTITEELRKYGTDVSKLRGFDFEDYLVKLFKGKGSFKMDSREFDGAYKNVWFEAKSGDYWIDRVGNKGSDGFKKFTSDMGSHLAIAKKYGKEFVLHSNSPIPKHVKLWLDKIGIKYFEHY